MKKKSEKENKKRNKKVKKPLIDRLLPILLSLVPLIVITFMTLLSLPSHKESLKPLAMLPVPEEQTVILPGPFVSNQIATSVLGAETIDPRDIVTYVNEERMKRGIRPLRVNDTLMKAAAMRANVILKYENFSHHDPYEHIQLDTMLPKLNYSFAYASENIGMGDTTGRAFVNGFMNSPPHRENLLNPELVETGVAIVTGKYKQYYVNIAVQIFAKPLDQTKYNRYTRYDEEEYKKLLSDIKKQIDTTKLLKDKDPKNAEFYDQWHRLLIRQQEIIATLAHAVHNEERYGRELISLIKEYNANWASVPIK
ncbi:MAG: CAP domain-containing protein [Patescibacteria group bacterium]|nr:CAP domain-containing protein [Patescibacteria group bacterium]